LLKIFLLQIKLEYTQSRGSRPFFIYIATQYPTGKLLFTIQNLQPMKRTFIIVLTVAICGLFQATTAFAQTDDEVKKAEKDAKKRSKEMEKESWETQAGPSLFDMLKKMYLMLGETADINGTQMSRYVYANGNAVAGTLAVAQRAAISKAKEEIILQIKSDVQGYVENVMVNAQLSSESAVTSDEMVSKFTTMTGGALNNTVTVVNANRKAGANYEVSVTVMYDLLKAVKDEIIKNLKEKVKDDKILEEEIKKVNEIGKPGRK